MMSAPAPRRLPLPAILLGALFFLGLLALMVYAVQRSGSADRDALPSALIGKPAPAFELPLLHDASIRVRSSELRGAPYVLNVWGSWCPACREEHPVLTRFALSKRVRVIGYDWKDSREDALRWLEQLGNPFLAVLFDPEGRTAIDWGVAAAPETFLVDARGVVRWKHAGPLTDQIIRDELLPALQQAERDAPPTRAQGKATP
ncbi:DsbE family thiol:disulfide interchange protein [Xanthomonas rydalmerensis]|uniref:DsbE family thiol:disulfide interchange protein n=2 Tax=Xanthomonas rydalmerensis TaxID=3046274 RepID=A0ABZ0JT39_9XANT|nr:MULTISPECIES: DsbE family thiol:disulfide interchange protein [unclassified Xanthomonas]WOS42994.1 DsbE family thiol:disulfide interchange protein [Xanthomonas sp. DM-2023]WOS47176.1 DsbE family thiol:disulfide interchange protein [Xanthomonas sp. DM-2023]WOS51355.1 DsbE family thiol:disulfide interchange protein [Xanthomonas sp. DM-2023]WOS55539.1 DsbE family thiol:disulfide interchange protein [Xanthomonas sp. DM-2023]WOS59720.1 DsbE family thiol:disulfide interchange protein [Xanthomonas